MNIYKTTRYPRCRKRSEGVDRAWLLSQLPNAKHPDALLAIALHWDAPWSIAARARITEDVLIDFLLGRDGLSAEEIRVIGFALGTGREFVCESYIKGEALTFVNDEDLDEYQQDMKDAYSRMDKKHPVCKLLPGLFEMRPLPLEVSSAPINIIERTPDEIEWSSRIKPRSAAMKGGDNDAA